MSGSNKKFTTIVGGLGLVLAGTYLLNKGNKTDGKEMESVIETIVEPTFCGMTESQLTDLAQSISRGERVKVLGDKVIEFIYRSKRGRQQQSTRFILDENDNLVRYVGMGPYGQANTPKFFHEKLLEAIKENK